MGLFNIPRPAVTFKQLLNCVFLFMIYAPKNPAPLPILRLSQVHMHKFSQPKDIPGNWGFRVSSLVVATAASLSSACDVFVLTCCDAFMPRGPDTLVLGFLTLHLCLDGVCGSNFGIVLHMRRVLQGVLNYDCLWPSGSDPAQWTRR